ncbi:hypothetical protein GGH95_000396, partial [Coemansia sp. RSA 1836]
MEEKTAIGSNDLLASETGVNSIAVPASGPERDAIVKRLKLKLDLRLVPYLALLYLFNALDRGNIGNA